MPRRALLYVAPLSFFVYVTQEPPLSVLQDLLERAAPGLPAILAYALPPLLVIALAVLVGLALRRVAPRAFAAASGGRVPGAAPLLAGAALPAGEHEGSSPPPTSPSPTRTPPSAAPRPRSIASGTGRVSGGNARSRQALQDARLSTPAGGLAG